MGSCRQFLVGILACVLATLVMVSGCSCEGIGSDGSGSLDDDNADDDADDDAGSDDDAGVDDDAGSGAPLFPQNHDDSWNCYICHEDGLYDAPQEPHGDAYDPPDDCVGCHDQGADVYTDPDAPEGHGAAVDCLDCHQSQHDRPWTETDQCLVCHQAGDPGPEFSQDHKTTWDCYICHENNFNGSPREPHDGEYDAPDICLACHAMGSFSSTRHGPEPEDDHTPSWDCLDCHSQRHSKPWQDNDQCKLCHRF